MSMRSGTNAWPNIVGRLVPRLRGSLYRRSADEVERLVSGASAYICDACIVECVAVLEKHGGFAGAGPSH